MPTAIARLSDRQAREAIAEVQASGVVDLALHLFESGRCAIAHATSKPIIDPDDPSDYRRLYRELPIIERLAELAIEERLGVKTSHTVYLEHLYELAGFKKAFGDEITELLRKGGKVPEDGQVNIPKISIGLRGKDSFPALEGLIPVYAAQDGSCLHLIFEREDGSIQFKCRLNFTDERLEFDIYDGIFCAPDDESSGYADRKADLINFQKWYFLNGRLELIDFESRMQISRKDAYLPHNVIVRPEEFDKDIEFWRFVAKQRRELETLSSQ